MVQKINVENVKVINYDPMYKSYFKDLNIQWLEELFSVEPHDEYVLNNPEEAILASGGAILFAVHEEEVIGTVGLKISADRSCEITKMAVAPDFRGYGLGKMICAAAIEKAKTLDCDEIILYTSSNLKNAIHIYEQLGFVHIPFEKGIYARGDVKMLYKG